MKRSQLNNLLAWKDKKNRKPLIVNGARQVGKTWLLKEFGRTYYENLAYINFESNISLKSLLLEGYDITRLLQAIQIETGVLPKPEKTLIIFDEIQLSPNAITSLKYFAEDAPQYHIVSAGSLLGIALSKDSSFPVGKVEFLDLYPLNFNEFLDALGHSELNILLANMDWTIIKTFREKFAELLRMYFYLGGMPEVIADFVQSGSFEKARLLQSNILRTYELDFSKHAPANIVPRIRMLWNSIPAQLSKENKKFIYKAVKEGSRAKDYELALHWLIDTGLIYKVHTVSVPKIPLKAYEDFAVFKLLLLDIGLLGAMADTHASDVVNKGTAMEEYKGALTEQYVLQQLKSNEINSIYYWSPNNLKAEIDFIIAVHGYIWPVEVKAGENLHAKSLRVFVEKYKPAKAIRTSLSDYRQEDWLINVPLYAIGSLIELLADLVREKM